MKEVVRNILIAIGAAFILTMLQVQLGSLYIIQFLEENLITIQIALLAINGTTLSIVLTKLSELRERFGKSASFTNTKKEMLFSIHEQIFLIAFSLILLLVRSSSFLNSKICEVVIIDVFVIACFVYALIILYDTSKSVFVLFDYVDKQDKK